MVRELKTHERTALNEASYVLAELANELELTDNDYVETEYTQIGFDELVVTANQLGELAEGPIELVKEKE